MISIHALRVEGDSTGTCSPRSCRDFYPRPPGGGRLYNRFAITDILGFLSTPSGWRATVVYIFNTVYKRKISIHALRVEGDDKLYEIKTQIFNISIHALRVEGDALYIEFAETIDKFLSTPSGWRATGHRVPVTIAVSISIHALRVEGDSGAAGRMLKHYEFLSTPSGWRATCFRCCSLRRRSISIHALRVEGDLDRRPIPREHENFYPRPPGGGRPLVRMSSSAPQRFLSTPSGWRATVCFFASLFGADFYPRPPGGGRPSASGPVCLFAGISIHALRVEGDTFRAARGPRTPISIHALRVEGDNAVPDAFQQRKISIHALRVEGDLPQSPRSSTRSDFYPRPPGGGRPERATHFCCYPRFLSTPSGWRATLPFF